MAKVKIKNRSHNDQAVAFQPLSQSSPFRVVQALVEVKSNCYVTVPIQVVKHPVLLISISSHLFSVPAARAWRSCPGIKVEMERGRPDRHLEGLRCLVLLTEIDTYFSNDSGLFFTADLYSPWLALPHIQPTV